MSVPHTRHILAWLIIFTLLFSFVYAIRSMLLPFILGAVIAYFLNPLTIWLQNKKIPRAAAAGAIIALFIGITTTCLVKFIPILINQSIVLVEIVPNYAMDLYHTYFPQVQQLANQFGSTQNLSAQSAAKNLSPQLSGLVQNIFSGLLGSGATVLNILSLLILTPVVAFYLLKDWTLIIEKADRLLPRQHANTIREQLALIDQTIAGFLRGQINVCLIISAYYAIALSLIDLNFAFAVGLFSGLMLIIPYAGTILSAGLALTLMWFQTQTSGDLMTVGAIYGVGMLLDSYLITPKLVGEKVGLHPVWILFGMLAGGALFGFVGVLLAIPVSAVIGVVLRFFIQRYLASSLYNEF